MDRHSRTPAFPSLGLFKATSTEYIQTESTLTMQGQQHRSHPITTEVHPMDPWKKDTNAQMKNCLPCFLGRSDILSVFSISLTLLHLKEGTCPISSTFTTVL